MEQGYHAKGSRLHNERLCGGREQWALLSQGEAQSLRGQKLRAYGLLIVLSFLFLWLWFFLLATGTKRAWGYFQHWLSKHAFDIDNKCFSNVESTFVHEDAGIWLLKVINNKYLSNWQKGMNFAEIK